MQWATKRKIIIIAIGAALFFSAGAAMVFFVFSNPASCSDGKQNGGEVGIDCGGSCLRLCSVQVKEPFVDFAQTVQDGNSTAIVARLVNPNERASVSGLRYEATLFSTNGVFLDQFEGEINIEPNKKVALYIPIGQAVLKEDVSRVSVEVSGGIFLQDSRNYQNIFIQDFAWSFSGGLPTLNLKVESLGQQILRQSIIAIAYGEGEKVLGAKRVIVPEINEKSSDVSLRWSTPFSGNPIRVEYFFE